MSDKRYTIYGNSNDLDGVQEAVDLVIENERLNNIINKLDKLIEQYSKNDYYYKYNGKYLKSEIINDLKTIRGVDKPRKGEEMSLEELESLLPRNTIEEEYDDWFWS